MPPKRYQRRKSTKPPIASASAAMADCVLPKNVIVSILTRLPVKSILRFKSVCRPWCKLFSTPNFIKLHHDQFSKDPRNQSVIIYSLSEYHDHTMSLYKIESNERKPINLHHPYPEIFFRMDFIGCNNGLVCMGCPPLGQGIVLWNPAMKLFKFARLSKEELGVPEKVSLGFGYDAEGDDFKIVRIVCLAKKKKNVSVGVEVYSANSDSWRTIKVGFQFHVLWTKNDAIVDGNPYWVAKVDENKSGRSDLGEVLVYFDVRKMVFKILPLSSLTLGEGREVPLVDWKGSIGALVCDKNNERVNSLDVWVFDDGGYVWTKNHTFGPIELKIERFLQCSRNGKLFGECLDGKLFVFDPENGCVKEIVIDESRKRSFEIDGYTESLACVKGMEKVVVKKNEEVKYEDENEDEDDSTEGPVVDIETFLRSYLHLNGSDVVGNYPVIF